MYRHLVARCTGNEISDVLGSFFPFVASLEMSEHEETGAWTTKYALRFTLLEDGLRCQAVESRQVAGLAAFIPRNAFDEYNIQGDQSYEFEFTLGDHGYAPKNPTVTEIYNGDIGFNNEKLPMIIKSSGFEIRYFSVESKDVPKPIIQPILSSPRNEYDSFSVEASEFCDAIAYLSMDPMASPVARILPSIDIGGRENVIMETDLSHLDGTNRQTIELRKSHGIVIRTPPEEVAMTHLGYWERGLDLFRRFEKTTLDVSISTTFPMIISWKSGSASYPVEWTYFHAPFLGDASNVVFSTP